MAMDFFEHQLHARKKTGLLVLMFIAAVIAIVVLTYLVVSIIYISIVSQQAQHGPPPTLWNPLLLLAVGGGVIVIVTFGSLFKMTQLSGGGRVVAESVGGRLINSGASDLNERKLLNVVEEMAIASGVPVPKVYVMDDENAINAFAAGFSSDDAVIAVTRGCIDQLSRDELQGVIAHEFSHILNGDMRLNIRLIGVLFGILVIGIIGRMVLSSLRYSGSSGRSRSGKNEGGGILVVLAVGIALLVIGYMGYFFGGLIKAAVSRQREFLADASAVQFTRNPDGISGALKKIGGYSLGSRIRTPRAEDVSHMFFGQGVSTALGGLSATHPPLDERIRRIDPNWDGRLADIDHPPKLKEKVLEQQATLSRGAARRQAIGALAAMQAGAMSQVQAPTPAVSHIGQPTQAHVDRAQMLLDTIPDIAKQATHSSLGACAVVFAMLLSDEQPVREAQLGMIHEHVNGPAADETARLADVLASMDGSTRLTLIDMAMPGLHSLAPGQYQGFKRCVPALIGADKRVDLFEWMLSHILASRLAPVFESETQSKHRIKYTSLMPVRDKLVVLLSTLARYGQRDLEAIQRAYNEGMRRLPFDPSPTLIDADRCGLRQLDEALSELNMVGPLSKRAVVNACAATIQADQQVTVEEAELLRAVCDSLGCPMPPLLPGQLLA